MMNLRDYRPLPTTYNKAMYIITIHYFPKCEQAEYKQSVASGYAGYAGAYGLGQIGGPPSRGRSFN